MFYKGDVIVNAAYAREETRAMSLFVRTEHGVWACGTEVYEWNRTIDTRAPMLLKSGAPHLSRQPTQIRANI